jgi:hypothetical protein
MRTTEEFKLVLVWLVGCFVAVIVGLAPVSSALSHGHYLPVGADAFYHARRILTRSLTLPGSSSSII